MTNKQISFRKKAAIALIIGGGVLFALPVQTSVVKNSVPISFSTGIMLSAIGAVLVAVGGRLNYRAKQYAAKNFAEQIATRNSDHDLLFLRAFSVDSTLNKVLKGANTVTVMQNLQSTVEEDLYKVFEPFGNLVAIGKPGEKLPVPGAVRTYADADWQDVVTDKMKNSRLVIIEGGEGDGLNWELKQAFKIVEPKKLLLFIPQMSKKSYDKFRHLALENIAVDLPDRESIKKMKAYGAIGFVRFTENRIPEFLPLTAPIFRVDPYKPFYARFYYALKPLFEEHGIQWQPPPIIKGYVVALVVMGTLILIIIVLAILSAVGKI
ncbi:MAG: hypothetical protein ABI358_12915 [Ginsengibacter sp.]